MSGRALPRAAAGNGYPVHFEASTDVPVSQRAAFDALDDHRRLSARMASNSLMMAGARMTVELDGGLGQAVGSRIALAGRVLGLALRVDEVVTTDDPPWRKVWETVDEPRLLVVGRYRMGFGVAPLGSGATCGSGWLGAVASRFYARWCAQQMLSGIRGA